MSGRGRSVLTMTAVGLVVLLLIELALRIGFPCDLYLWSESPFMTNMMKLVDGVPLFSDPADVNSFIYTPALQYITYAVLAPVGLALDVRFCRVVNIVVGLGAAATLAYAGLQLARTLGERQRGLFLVTAFALATLLVFSNFTAAVPHPDNLQMLHAALTLVLCQATLRRGSFPLAVATMLFAALGLLTKQNAALTWAGAGAALVLGRRWGRQRAAAILLAGVIGFACVVAPLLLQPNVRFFTLELPLSQGFVWSKAVVLFDDFFRGHRLILTTIAPVCLLRIWQGGGEVARRYLVAWTALACTAVLPNLAPYLKNMGSDNNLWIMGFWLLAPVLPFLAGTARVDGEALRVAAFALVLAALLPVRLPPSPGAYAYCHDLVQAVGADLRAGRRVLLAHGTAPLIQNGAVDVPLDRGNTILEYMYAGRLGLTQAMTQRLLDGHYDRIYANGAWYFWNMPTIDKRYREVDRIPRATKWKWAALPYRWGEEFVYNMAAEVVVYGPK